MANRYWVGGTGTWDGTAGTKWALTSGGAGGQAVPTAADAVFFDANSGTNTVTLGANANCLTLNMTGFTGTLDFSTFKISAAGNSATVYVGSTTFTALGNKLIELTYSGSTGTRTFSTGAVTESNSLSFNIIAGSDIVNAGARVLNLDFTGFSGSFTNGARTIYGNLTVSTGMTLNSGTGTLTFGATSGTQTVTSNGKTFDFPLTVNASNATISFADALTQGSTRAFTFTAGTIKFKNSVISTVGAFATSGTTQKTLNSSSAGSQATLSQASGTVNANYLTIKDSNATGGAIFNAFTDTGGSLSANNINSGNNTGWNFIPNGGGFLSFF